VVVVVPAPVAAWLSAVGVAAAAAGVAGVPVVVSAGGAAGVVVAAPAAVAVVLISFAPKKWGAQKKGSADRADIRCVVDRAPCSVRPVVA
jgi:hypothetical protein